MFKFKNLKVKYGKHLVIDIKNYSFKEKGLYCIVGPNGSGKTTLFKAMSNIIKYEGDIYFNDVSIKEYKDNLYNYVCYLDQFGNFINNLSEKDNYNLLKDFLSEDIKEEFSDKKISKLSGGERKKFEEKRLDFNSYKAYLLDEPSTSLDTDNASYLIDKLKELSKDKLVIIISHDERLIECCSEKLSIWDLENECTIKPKTYNVIKKTVEKENINKVFKSQLMGNIFRGLILIIFMFSFVMFLNFITYSDERIEKDIGSLCGYCQLQNEDYDNSVSDIKEDFKNDNYATDYFGEDLSDYTSGISDDYSFGESFYIYSGPQIIYSFSSGSVEITDYVSYLIFGDFANHDGETFNYTGQSYDESYYNDEEDTSDTIEFTITDTIDTFFSESFYQKYNDSSSLETYFDLIDYIVIPYSYYDSFSDYINQGKYSFINYYTNSSENVPSGYCISTTIENYGYLYPALLNYQIFSGLASFISLIFLAYFICIKNYNKHDKMNDLLKIKSLGGSKKMLEKLTYIPLIIELILASIISLLNIAIVINANNEYTPELMKSIGVNYITPNYVYIVVVVLLDVIIFMLLKLKFKKRIGF